MSNVRILSAGEAAPVADPAAAFAQPMAAPPAATAVPVPQPAPAPVSVPPAPRPSELMARTNARQPVRLTMPSGRHITVRPLSALERMFAFKAIGAELITNAGYANYSLVACSVVDIDGMPITMPTSNMTIEVIIQRIGEDFDDLAEMMQTAFKGHEGDAFDPETVKN